MSGQSRKLYDAITNIDDDIIEAALNVKPAGKVVKFNFAKAATVCGIVAACLCVGLITIAGIRQVGMKGEKMSASESAVGSVANDACMVDEAVADADYSDEYFGGTETKEDESTSTSTVDYDRVYDLSVIDETGVLTEMLRGKKVPVEIVYGFGGEAGYNTYSTTDENMIEDYLTALRSVRIESTIDSLDEFVRFTDYITDMTFIFEDGTEVMFSYDGGRYVIYDDVQYVFDFSAVNKLNSKLSK